MSKLDNLKKSLKFQKDLLVDYKKEYDQRDSIIKDLESLQDNLKCQVADAELECLMLREKIRKLK